MHASMLNTRWAFLKPNNQVIHINNMLSQYVGIPLSFGMGKVKSAKILSALQDSCDNILDQRSSFCQAVDSITYYKRVTFKNHVPDPDLLRKLDPYLHSLSLYFQWPQQSVQFSTQRRYHMQGRLDVFGGLRRKLIILFRCKITTN